MTTILCINPKCTSPHRPPTFEWDERPYLLPGGYVVAAGTPSNFYDFDHSGNTRILVASDGNTVTDTRYYRAFGEILASTGATSNLFWFGGEYGGLQDTVRRIALRARILDVLKAVWMSRDPLGIVVDWSNLYCYVMDNPVMYIDPEGLWSRTGTATCFNDSGLFCNHDLSNPHCPQYSHGMTGAWPNVTQHKIKGCCGNDKRTYNSGLTDDSGNVIYVECGNTVTVTIGKCSVKITIIDAGPNSNAASNAIVDLSPQAARTLWNCLHPVKRGRRRRGHFSCDSFEVSGVTVSG